MNNYYKTAISLIDPKETALYFDHIIPINLGLEVLVRGITPEQFEVTNIFPRGMGASLMPPALLRKHHFAENLAEVNTAFFYWMLKHYSVQQDHQPTIEGLSKEEFTDIEHNAIRAFDSFLNDFGLVGCVIDVPDFTLNKEESNAANDIVITICELDLIDASKASWDHILEFRRSTSAKESLRRLRLFAFENYKGKDKAFIEDDLLMRLDEHSHTVAEWGFQTKHGALSSLFSSKFLAGAVTGSFISTLLGQPLPAILSAVGGLGLELGSLALNVQKRHFELRKIIRNSPVTYIHEARQNINIGQQKNRGDRE